MDPPGISSRIPFVDRPRRQACTQVYVQGTNMKACGLHPPPLWWCMLVAPESSLSILFLLPSTFCCVVQIVSHAQEPRRFCSSTPPVSFLA